MSNFRIPCFILKIFIETFIPLPNKVSLHLQNIIELHHADAKQDNRTVAKEVSKNCLIRHCFMIIYTNRTWMC